MTNESDPKRLLDELGDAGSGLGRMLRAGKSEVPNDAQMIALAAKIGVIGGIGGAGAAGAAGGGGASGAAGGAASAKAAATVTTAAKAGLALKIGSAVVVASAATASVVVVTKHHDVTTTAPIGIVAPSASQVGVGRASPSQQQATGSSTAILPLPDDDPDPAPSTSAAHRPRTQASAPDAEGEVRLLERAQDALRSRPADALQLADEHARRFPQGMLAQEREVIAIEALVKLNRMSDAKARAARFKARFPGSSHTRRIDALIGE